MQEHIFEATLTGIRPLILHNGELANPRSECAKALAAVTKGKAKDLDKAARCEFIGSLYLDSKGAPCVPVDNVLSTVIAGAKAFKLGKQAAAGIYDMPEHQTFPIQYKGPKDPIALFGDDRFVDSRGVRVQQSRVQRTRPIFREWKLTVLFEFDPELITRDDLLLALQRAGKAVGIGDYRPRYGRFTVEARNS